MSLIITSLFHISCCLCVKTYWNCALLILSCWAHRMSHSREVFCLLFQIVIFIVKQTTVHFAWNFLLSQLLSSRTSTGKNSRHGDEFGPFFLQPWRTDSYFHQRIHFVFPWHKLLKVQYFLLLVFACWGHTEGAGATKLLLPWNSICCFGYSCVITGQ